MQCSEEKSQNPREMVSERNEDHIKTEGRTTSFGDTQRSAYTRHPKEDSSEGNEGNGSHMGTCGYDNTHDSDNEKGLSPNLSFSPDMSMQMNDDEAPNINYIPCESYKGILYDTSSDSDGKFIIKKVTSDNHSSRPTKLTATTPDMSLQISSRRYNRASDKNSPNKVKANVHSSNNLPSELMYDHLSGQPHDKQIQSRGRGLAAENYSHLEDKCHGYFKWSDTCQYEPSRKASHINYSTGDSDEDIRYKKITTEDHLPNPRPNRPRAPPAPPPVDPLD